MIPSDVSLLFSTVSTANIPEIQKEFVQSAETELPINFEQADVAYEELIDSICKTNPDKEDLENALRTQKKIILYDLQKLQNAGFSDISFAYRYIEGARNLEEMANNFQHSCSSFNQDLDCINSKIQALTNKISETKNDQLYKSLIEGVAGAVVGDVASQKINLVRDYLYNKAGNAFDRVKKDPKQKKVLAITEAQLEALSKIGEKLKGDPISKAKIRLGGAVSGGIIGVVAGAVLEAADTKPAH